MICECDGREEVARMVEIYANLLDSLERQLGGRR